MAEQFVNVMSKNSPKETKVFIGLREIAGYFSGLKSGFDELGIKSVLVDIGGQPFNYKIEKNPAVIRFLNRICTNISRFSYRNNFLRIFWIGVVLNFIGFFVFIWAIFNYNTFIFSSNSTFFFYLELPVLRLFRKKIIYVFMGTESRPLYLSGKVKVNNPKQLKTGILLTKIQKKTINRIEKYSNYIISIHPQALFQQIEFVSGVIIGFPQKILLNEKFSNKDNIDLVRILHAPTHREAKGSDIFAEKINNLKVKGYKIDYIELTNKPNREVLDEISKCDFVLDELYSDCPLAGFSTEAAFLKKPSVIGSYYSDYIQNDIPGEFIPPSMFYNPDNIEEAIEKLIIDREFRRELGQQAYDFVTRKWTPKEVAKKYMKLINNECPKEWLFDPENINYVYGAGQSKIQVKENVKKFIEKRGINSLCLRDKPHLEKKFLDMIKE